MKKMQSLYFSVRFWQASFRKPKFLVLIYVTIPTHTLAYNMATFQYQRTASVSLKFKLGTFKSICRTRESPWKKIYLN